MAETDVLWGGILTAVELDPVAWRLTANVVVTNGQSSTRYRMLLEEVRSLRVDRIVPLPWEYAELTEVHVSKAADGLTVDLVMWEDDTGLTAACSRLSVSPTV